MPDAAHISDLEDTDSTHLPKINPRPEWLKPIPEEDRPKTPEPDWSVPPNDLPEPENNWAKMHSLGKKQLCKSDLEGLTFKVVKAFHENNISLQFQMEECHRLLTDRFVPDVSKRHRLVPDVSKLLPLGGPLGDKGRRSALSISKLKAAQYLDFGLEELVPSLWIESEHKYDINVAYELTTRNTRSRSLTSKILHPNDFEDLYLLHLQGQLNHLSGDDKVHLFKAVNMWIRNIVIRKRMEDLQLGIESYQTKLNLTQPDWDASDFLFKEDYTIVSKPRAVIYRDRNDQKKMMRET
ncbi:hypothetical protein Tco_0681827 [Tanacetum coccineum]|uniref:Uncharacterized protein n=1 Tax=Tanacetum coccineum TaxID=301880 RepID=A0ABQ4XRD4_9ASTR